MLYLKAVVLGILTVFAILLVITVLGWIVSTLGAGGFILLFCGCGIFYTICWFWYEELKSKKEREDSYYGYY